VSSEAADAFLTVLPETRSRWEPVARRGWAWWNFAIAFMEDSLNGSGY